MTQTKHIFNVICLLLFWQLAVVFVSCSVDDECDLNKEVFVSMNLNISARDEGDLNSRAVDSEIGTNSEYIHNLCVFIVKNDVVVKKFLPNFDYNSAAMSGNLKSWISETFTLETGDYIIYGFANIDSYLSTVWTYLTEIGEGDNISDIGIDEIVLDDPASKLDFVDYFIPMSAKYSVKVTSSTKSISVGLDRLISKIRMNVTGKAGTKVSSLSFGGYADKITLISEVPLSGETYGCNKTIAIPDEGLLESQAGNVTGNLAIPDFYVNSSPSGHRFTVNIKTVETDGIIHDAVAVTKRDELPRNSIFPLTVQLNEYELDLEAMCWVNPIGSLPVEVAVSFLPHTYIIKVPEGCQFAFTVNGVYGGTSVEDLSTEWNIKSPVNGIVFDGATSGVTTIKGHVTASAGKKFELDLLVSWTDGTASYKRIYTVILMTEDLTEFPLFSKTRNSDIEMNFLYPEMVNIFLM